MAKAIVMKLDERVLLLKLREGDEKAFSRIYDAYWKTLFEYGFIKLKSVPEAEDLVSDLFAELWNKRDEIDIHTSLGNYLSIWLKHKILDHFRSRKIKESHHTVIAQESNASANIVDDKISFEETYHLWMQTIDNLPAQCQLVYKMSAFDDLSTREISAKLDLSERTVENHKYRAIKQLKLKLTVFSMTSFFIIKVLFLTE